MLFDFITSEIFVQNDISTHIKQNFDQIKTIKVSEFQDISSQTFLESDLGLETAAITSKTLNADDSVSKLELGRPLQFDQTETFSFSEWLRVAQKKPIDRSESSQPEEESIRDKKFALIDAFISNKPKLKPLDKHSKLINIAEDSVFETEDLMTETLARIYVEQKNYDKAIQSYRILSLKYPEKSSLFADQIQSIKVLKEKNNI